MKWPAGLVATHAGLRGRPGVELTPAVVEHAVRSFAALLRARGLPAVIAVARDSRPEGRSLVEQVTGVAIRCGLDIVDFGEASTPTAKLGARVRGLAGAVVVTASHLGPEWNGLKLIAGPLFTPVDLRELPPAAPDARAADAGTVRSDANAAADHADAVCRSVDVALIRRAGLRVDCTGGVGPVAGAVLERLGCRPVVDGRDAGLVLDPDADRLELVDECGRTRDTDVVLPLAALAREPRIVVKGDDTSRMVDDVVRAWGGSVHRVPPGELHLVEASVETGADLAGEGNGGVVYPAVGLARDAVSAAALVLELMARTGHPLSVLTERLPRYVRQRTTVPSPSAEEGLAALETVAGRLGAVAPEDPSDGVRIEGRDGSWGLIRQSATEPVLRITAEARTAAAARAFHARLRNALEACVDAA
jgi:phosphomannomutase